MVIKLENKKFSGEVMMDLSEELKMLTTHYLQQKYMNMALQDTTRMLLGYLSYPWQRIKINTPFIVWKQLIRSFPKKFMLGSQKTIFQKCLVAAVVCIL